MSRSRVSYFFDSRGSTIILEYRCTAHRENENGRCQLQEVSHNVYKEIKTHKPDTLL